MKFRFCGEADCPDWVLVEINTLSRLSSIKLKLLVQVVVKGLLDPPIDKEKAEKLFAESKLDSDVDLKACIACISYILTSTTRFNCDSNALQNELQQLGLPREHSASLKRVLDDNFGVLTEKFRENSLKVNALESLSACVDHELNCALVDIKVNGKSQSVTLTPKLIDNLLENLEKLRKNMVELQEG